jgi:hypothetical protein
MNWANSMYDLGNYSNSYGGYGGGYNSWGGGCGSFAYSCGSSGAIIDIDISISGGSNSCSSCGNSFDYGSAASTFGNYGMQAFPMDYGYQSNPYVNPYSPSIYPGVGYQNPMTTPFNPGMYNPTFPTQNPIGYNPIGSPFTPVVQNPTFPVQNPMPWGGCDNVYVMCSQPPPVRIDPPTTVFNQPPGYIPVNPTASFVPGPTVQQPPTTVYTNPTPWTVTPTYNTIPTDPIRYSVPRTMSNHR